jgi:hypothetical protein
MILVSFGGGDGTGGCELSPYGPNLPDGNWGRWPRVTSANMGRYLAPCEGTGIVVDASVYTDT